MSFILNCFAPEPGDTVEWMTDWYDNKVYSRGKVDSVSRDGKTASCIDDNTGKRHRVRVIDLTVLSKAG